MNLHHPTHDNTCQDMSRPYYGHVDCQKSSNIKPPFNPVHHAFFLDFGDGSSGGIWGVHPRIGPCMSLQKWDGASQHPSIPPENT
jgi:hypothetical protein